VPTELVKNSQRTPIHPEEERVRTRRTLVLKSLPLDVIPDHGRRKALFRASDSKMCVRHVLRCPNRRFFNRTPDVLKAVAVPAIVSPNIMDPANLARGCPKAGLPGLLPAFAAFAAFGFGKLKTAPVRGVFSFRSFRPPLYGGESWKAGKVLRRGRKGRVGQKVSLSDGFLQSPELFVNPVPGGVEHIGVVGIVGIFNRAPQTRPENTDRAGGRRKYTGQPGRGGRRCQTRQTRQKPSLHHPG
jgi:hypothetical protein